METDEKAAAKIDPDNKLQNQYNGDFDAWMAGERDDLDEKMAYHWTKEEYGDLEYKLQELYLQKAMDAMEQIWRDRHPECKFTRHHGTDWLVIEYLTDDTRLPYASETGYGSREQWHDYTTEMMQHNEICTAMDAIAHFGSTIKRGYEKKLDKIAN